MKQHKGKQTRFSKKENELNKQQNGETSNNTKLQGYQKNDKKQTNRGKLKKLMRLKTATTTR